MSDYPFPLHYPKSEAEIAADRYERWDPTVLRQIVLHQCDALHGGYPGQAVLDYVSAWLPVAGSLRLVELGCGVGRLVAELAKMHPGWTCEGLDYSTALLQRAHYAYTRGDNLLVDAGRFGWGQVETTGHRIPNITWGLARAEQLPYADFSQEVFVSSFLLDRLEHPMAALSEWWRCLRRGGRVVVVTPLNFYLTKQWKSYYPPVKLMDPILAQGWQISDWREGITVSEPLDGHGNAVHWRCLGFCLEKR